MGSVDCVLGDVLVVVFMVGGVGYVWVSVLSGCLFCLEFFLNQVFISFPPTFSFVMNIVVRFFLHIISTYFVFHRVAPSTPHLLPYFPSPFHMRVLLWCGHAHQTPIQSLGMRGENLLGGYT